MCTEESRLAWRANVPWRKASILIGWASRRTWNNDPRRHTDVTISHPSLQWRHYGSIDQWRHWSAVSLPSVGALSPSLFNVAQRRGHGESFVVVPRLIYFQTVAFPTAADFPAIQNFALRTSFQRCGGKLPDYYTRYVIFFHCFITRFRGFVIFDDVVGGQLRDLPS